MKPRMHNSAGALFWLTILTVGCAARPAPPFVLTEVETDKTYGYTENNPIKIGGVAEGEKARHREAFLNALRGPQGQPISFVSHGSCCMFDVGTGGKVKGNLEVLLVTYPKIPKPVILYLDAYHFETPKAPQGFTFASPSSGTSQP